MSGYLSEAEQIKIPKKETCLVGAGTRGITQASLTALQIANFNALEYLNSGALLSSDPIECAEAFNRFNKATIVGGNGRNHIKGDECRLFSVNLMGNSQYLNNPATALENFHLYSGQILTTGTEHAKHINSSGGVQLFFCDMSVGGHFPVELAYNTVLSLQIPRPRLVVGSLARPRRTDTVPSKIFHDRLEHLAKNDFRSMPNLIIVDNQSETVVLSLRMIDLYTALAKAAPFGGTKVNGQKNYFETWNLLARKRIIGVKATEFQLRQLGITKTFFGIKYGTQWKYERRNVISGCTNAIRSLQTDPNKNISGLPEAEDGVRIFYVIGGVDMETFQSIKMQCEIEHGLCQLCPSSAFGERIFIIELFNIDPKALFDDVGIEAPLPTDTNGSSTGMDCLDDFMAKWAKINIDHVSKLWRDK